MHWPPLARLSRAAAAAAAWPAGCATTRRAARPPGPLLEITDLAVSIPTESGTIEAVRGISLAIGRGETIGVVGESGSGKTMLALSVMGLLPRRRGSRGSIRLDGTELLGT